MPVSIERKDDFAFTSSCSFSSSVHDNFNYPGAPENRVASFYKISLSDEELGAAYPDITDSGTTPNNHVDITPILETLEVLKSNINKDRQGTSEGKSVHIVEINDSIQTAKSIFERINSRPSDSFKVSQELLNQISEPGKPDDARILFKGSRTNPETSSIIVKYPVLFIDPSKEVGFSNYLKCKQLNGAVVRKSKLSTAWRLSLVINEDIIFFVRPCQKSTQNRLISPGQLRTGAFHLLIHSIIDDIRENERQVLGMIQTMVNKHEFNMSTKTPASDVGLLKAVSLVLDDQITTLKELKNVFSHATDKADPTSMRKYTEDMLKIPVISGESENTSEQIFYVLASLERVIENREEVGRKIMQSMEKIGKKIDVKSSEELQSTMQEQLDAQKVQGQALQDEITFQAKAISLFTVLNAIFLPLGFFSQYFTGSDQRNGVILKESIGRFWAVTGSITGLIALSSFCWLFSNYQPRQILRCVCDLFTINSEGRRPHHILPASLALEQEYYRRKLPKYFVVAQPIDEQGNLFQGPALGDMFLTCQKDPVKDFGVSLKFDSSSTNVFLFDKTNGWLFHPEVDRYKYMYHPKVECVFPHNEEEMPVEWGRSSKLFEEEPYRFLGRFKVDSNGDQMSLVWEFSQKEVAAPANQVAGPTEKVATPAKRRWDTTNVKSASVFKIDKNTGKLLVMNPWSYPRPAVRNPSTNPPATPPYYRLCLVPDYITKG
ncbi:hypothetical protein EDC01DRAFT_660339 [Geopyxis carbonaria]|nr:hypothetical protein EDC01DRAFT_660339 [Geopyxis carbonaria]